MMLGKVMCNKKRVLFIRTVKKRFQYFLIWPLCFLLMHCAAQEKMKAPLEEAACECNCPPCSSENQLTPQLMSLISSARAFHHQADIYLRQKQAEEAINVLNKILDLPLDSKWPEAEEIRLDATARLALLYADEGKFKKGLDLLQSEINKMPHLSFYLGNLYGAQGEIYEKQSLYYEKQRNIRVSQSLAKQAIDSYEKAIQINKKLQAQMGGQKP